MTIWDGGGPGQQPEDEREAEWHDSDSGDLPFLADPEDWRNGHPMGPEERAFRDMLESEDDDTDPEQ